MQVQNRIIKLSIEDADFDELEKLGFRIDGCDLVSSLLEKSNRSQIPKLPGVYAVLRTDTGHPESIIWPYGDLYKKKGEFKQLMYNQEELERSWISDSSIVYIGKADKNLNERLNDYLDYYVALKECQHTKSHINQVAHRGGRSIWQLKNAEDLLFVWMLTSTGQIPRDVESALIQRFKSRHNGHRPFANKRD